MAHRFYAVVKGRQTGVFNDWFSQVEPLVNGYPGAVFKGFSSHEQAEDWILFMEKRHESNAETARRGSRKAW